MQKERKTYLDAVGGLLILWVILCHIQSLTNHVYLKTRYLPLLFCFMGWFFFKAGMFFRKRVIREEISAVVKRLLVPYVFFTGIGILSAFIFECAHGTDYSRFFLRILDELLKGGAVYYTAPAWFLLTLAIVRVLFQLASKYHITGLTLLISLCSAYSLSHYSITAPVYFGNISLGLFFYGMGFYMKDIQYQNYIFYTATAVYVFMYCFFPSNVDFRINSVTYGTYIGYILSAVSAIVVLNNLFYRIPFLSSRTLVHLGKHSMPYYLCHWPLVLFTLKIVRSVHPSTEIANSIIAISVCLIGLPILYKIFSLAPMRKYVGES